MLELGIGLAVLFALLAFASSARATETPVAAYSFDEGEGSLAADASGENDGTVEGATWAGGKYGTALRFDNEDEALVSIPDDPSLQLTEAFTLEAWVRPQYTQHWLPVLTKETPGFMSYQLYAGGETPGKAEGYVSPENGKYTGVSSPEPLPVRTWSHLALTCDGEDLKLYVDGELADSAEECDVQSSFGELLIGGNEVFNEYLNGRIDEVRLYDRALSPEEIVGDMETAISTPSAEDPIAAYSFDEGEGGTANDAFGSHDGAIEGAEWVGGKYGSALHFDNEDEAAVTIPHSPELELSGSFTLEAWVRPDHSQYWTPVLAKQTDDFFGYALYGNGENLGTPEGYVAQQDWEFSEAKGEEIEPRAWTHLALACDGETLRLYIDGELADTGGRCSAQSSEGVLQIGANEVFNEWFNGTIDEVRIYNRALGTEEIEDDRETAIETPPAEDPIAAYSFDEGEGGTAHDAYGDNDGTIDGAEWVTGKFGKALRFDREAEDSVEIPASLDLDLSDAFTLMAWVKPEEHEYWMPVAVRETPAYHSYALYAAGEVPSKPQGMVAERNWEASEALAEEALSVGEWAHLTLTSDGEDLKLFVNEELVDTAPASSAQHSEDVLRIGGHEAWGYYFDGLIDEVRVYDRAVAVGAPHCEDIEVGAVSGKERRVRLECDGKGKLEYEIEEEPENGTITEFDPKTGTLTYTPGSLFAGDDSFRFSASSALGQSNEALATLKVCGRPLVEASGQAYDPERPGVRLNLSGSPAGEPCEEESEPIESLKVYIDEELVFSEERDCDDPEPCEFDSLSMSRSVQLPYAKVLGEHDFEVRVKDRVGIEAVPLKWKEETDAAATISAVPPPSKDEGNPGECGTPKNRDAGEEDEYKKRGKKVIGTPCADIFFPYAGKTSFYGGGGNDIFRLGGELNRVFGQDGADTIYSGRGNDEVFGGIGNDRIFAGSGDDLLQGGDGNDFLAGTSGADDIRGGDGKDFVQGGGTTDTLDGGPGENTISFADGVTPGFEFNPPELPVTNFPAGREGRGVYVFLNESGNSVLDNAEMALYGGGTEAERDTTAAQFTNVIGTPFADVIIAGDKANLIDGGGGTDIIEGKGGDDEIYGGADGDYIDGGTGQSAKPIKAGPGDDICVNDTPGKTECDEREVKDGLASSPELIAVGTTNPDDPENDSALYLRGTPKKESVVATWQVSEGEAETHFVARVGEFDTALNGLGVSGCTVSKTVADCPMAGISSLVMYGGGSRDVLEAKEFPVAVSVNLLGGEGGDSLRGGEKSEDILVDGPGAEGVDWLRGEGGDDTLIANEGKDIMVGSGGSDLFVSSAICEGDVISGGVGGRDNASWAQLAGAPEEGNPGHREDPPYGVEVDIPEDDDPAQPISSYKGPCATPGDISGINHLEGSSAADRLEGNDELNIVLGRNGADWLRGDGGDDVLLANNGDPENKKDEAKRLDADEQLKCDGGSKDVLRYSAGDKPLLKEATDCEQKISSEDVNGRTSSLGGAGVDAEARTSEPDERTVGALEDPDAQAPAAFYRLDDASGTEVLNWSDGEAPGSYQGGVSLAEPGAIESSEGVSLDGTDDYIDLTDALDPAEFEVLSCGYVPSGFAVEMWVKFDTESSSRETLFSRAEDGSAMSVYRDTDGHVKFSVANPIEAPTVTSDRTVEQGSWHHVVAVVEEVSEGCISFAEAPSPGGDPGREGNRMAIYLDGFPTSLWVSGSPFPESMPSASNLVGAEDGSGGLSRWLDGTVDGVALYTDALSETEVGDHLAISDAPPLDVVLLPEFDLTDSDEDGLRDGLDNCAEVVNPDQADEDLDGVGDACEEVPDQDEDGVGDEDDNCPEEPNALQEDEDEDGVGDACEE